MATSVSGGGVLDLVVGTTTITEAISIAGNGATGSLVQSVAGTTTLTGGVTLTGNATIDVSNATGARDRGRGDQRRYF